MRVGCRRMWPSSLSSRRVPAPSRTGARCGLADEGVDAASGHVVGSGVRDDDRRGPPVEAGPGYANRLQHADDLGPPSHNLTVRLHPVQVRMQQRLERAPITLDDRGMRD
jgi:hypothetical protein